MDQDARHRLEDLLDREIELARSLAATLAAERTALTGESPEAVEKNGRRKNSGSAKHRKARGRTPGAVRQIAESSRARATVVERWRALMALMAGCRTANDVNGHIIHVRQHQIRQLIEIVRGGPAITYDPQGKTFAKALRALARA